MVRNGTFVRVLGRKAFCALAVIFRPAVRVARGKGMYARLILITGITVTAAILGFLWRPQSHPIPTGTSTHPVLDVMATQKKVDVVVSRAYLAQQYLTLQMTVSTLNISGNINLYIELSGVQPERYFDRPFPEPTSWNIASDKVAGEYSIGHTYSLKPNSYYSFPLSFEFDNCECYIKSGQYVAITPLYLDPLLLGNQQMSSGGYSLQRVTDIPDPAPGLKGGPYYQTTLQSIGQDEVDISSASVSSALTQVSSNPQSPTDVADDVWSWNNIAYANAAFSDPSKQDDISNHLFYDGIVLGIVGGGLLAIVPEASLVIEEMKKRRKERKAVRRQEMGSSVDDISVPGAVVEQSLAATSTLPTPSTSHHPGLMWPLLGAAGGIAIGWVVGRSAWSRRN